MHLCFDLAHLDSVERDEDGRIGRAGAQETASRDRRNRELIDEFRDRIRIEGLRDLRGASGPAGLKSVQARREARAQRARRFEEFAPSYPHVKNTRRAQAFLLVPAATEN